MTTVLVATGGSLAEPGALPESVRALRPLVLLLRVGTPVLAVPAAGCAVAVPADESVPEDYQGLPVAGVRRASTAYDGIVTAAAEADLIVLGARPESLLERLFDGGFAERIAAETGRPVLLVPTFPPWAGEESSHA